MTNSTLPHPLAAMNGRIISHPPEPGGAAAAAPETILAARRFHAAAPPPRPLPIFRLAGATIATPGNIQAVSAQPKAGKTALIGGFIASTMQPDGDTLGVESSNPAGAAIIHFDTEQSPFDHHAVVAQALRRAGRDDAPAWLRSYWLADVGVEERRRLLRFEMEAARQAHGAIHSVILDGVADFVHDPNDPAEAFALVGELHRLAIGFDTAIVCVLHENPGHNESGKTRGHLGSQLERKAETNLRLSKDGAGITVAFTERARHAHVTRDHGPRFTWDDGRAMHVSVAGGSEPKGDGRREQHKRLAAECFRSNGGAGLTWQELHIEIEKMEGCSRATARRRFEAMTKLKIIRKYRDKYRLR